MSLLRRSSQAEILASASWKILITCSSEKASSWAYLQVADEDFFSNEVC